MAAIPRKVMINVRIDADLLRDIDALAKAELRNRSNMINKALAEALSARAAERKVSVKAAA